MAIKHRPIGFAPLMSPGTRRDMELTVAGHMPAKHNWIRHPFTVYAVGLVTAGHGTYQVDDGPVQAIGPGSLFAVYPGPVFHYGPAEGTTWEEFHVGCRGGGLKTWMRAGWFFTDGSVRHLTNLVLLRELFGELLELRRRNERGDHDRALVLADRLMLEMYYAQEKFQREAAGPSPVEDILRYCRQNPGQRIDFKHLARRHAVSYSLLRQRIRRITGQAPAKHLTTLRCDRARTLLTDTDLPIKRIAGEVGIGDPYTFSRTFKRTVGVAPEQYRRQARAWTGR